MRAVENSFGKPFQFADAAGQRTGDKERDEQSDQRGGKADGKDASANFGSNQRAINRKQRDRDQRNRQDQQPAKERSRHRMGKFSLSQTWESKGEFHAKTQRRKET